MLQVKTDSVTPPSAQISNDDNPPEHLAVEIMPGMSIEPIKSTNDHHNGLRFHCFGEDGEIACLPGRACFRRFLFCHPTKLERTRGNGVSKMMTGLILQIASITGVIASHTLNSNVTISNPVYFDSNSDAKSPLNQFYLYCFLITGMGLTYSGISDTFCTGYQNDQDT